MKAVVAAFNQEKALVGAFSVIVQQVVEPMEHYTALLQGEHPAGAGGRGRAGGQGEPRLHPAAGQRELGRDPVPSQAGHRCLTTGTGATQHQSVNSGEM